MRPGRLLSSVGNKLGSIKGERKPAKKLILKSSSEQRLPDMISVYIVRLQSISVISVHACRQTDRQTVFPSNYYP